MSGPATAPAPRDRLRALPLVGPLLGASGAAKTARRPGHDRIHRLRSPDKVAAALDASTTTDPAATPNPFHEPDPRVTPQNGSSAPPTGPMDHEPSGEPPRAASRSPPSRGASRSPPSRGASRSPPPRAGGATDPGTVDGKKLRVVVADEDRLRDESVLGHNHVRRRPEEVEAERAHLRRVAPRWRRTWHYRFRNSARIRLLCILLPCVAGASTAAALFWHLEEEIAGIAVALVVFLAGLTMFVSTEIMIRCPNLTKGLLRDLGVIHPVHVETRVWAKRPGGEGRRAPKASDSDIEAEIYDLNDDGADADEAMEVGGVPPEALGGAEALYGAVDDHPEFYAEHPAMASRKPVWGDVARQSRRASEKLRRAGEQVIARLGADNPLNMMARTNPFAGGDPDYGSEEEGGPGGEYDYDMEGGEGYGYEYDYEGARYEYDYDGEYEDEDDGSARDAPEVEDPRAVDPTPHRAPGGASGSDAEDGPRSE